MKKEKEKDWEGEEAEGTKRGERKGEQRNKQRYCFTASGRHGRKRGRREREKSTGVHKERETD